MDSYQLDQISTLGTVVIAPDRLVAFGCSLTYGHGLADCWQHKQQKPGLTPSQLAWPAVCARELGWQCVNHSGPGWSNKHIWHAVHTHDWQPGDFAVIQWTFVHRWCRFVTADTNEHFTPHHTAAAAVAYYQHLYAEYDSALDLMLRSRDCHNHPHIPQQLQLQPPNDQHWPQHEFHVLLSQTHSLAQAHFVDTAPIMTFTAVDKALDHVHPGPQSHHAQGVSISRHISNRLQTAVAE